MTDAPSLTTTPTLPVPLAPEDYDALDLILDDLRTRSDETPQWEFCEGFLAALVCCRRQMAPEDYLPVLLDVPEEGGALDALGGHEDAFADADQRQRFMDLWQRRWHEVSAALDAEVQGLDEEAAYHPEVMDVRGAVAALPEEERPALAQEDLPAFGQVWALGFMFAVEAWPEEWVPPRDKEAAKWLDGALQALVALTEDDTDEPTVAVFDDNSPPSVSVQRMEAFAAAIWAVYDLRELWRNVGPRVATVRAEVTPGRNDPCFCGSGKKYKKCHGA
ncbi:MAG: UPF0149 family protein [Betaproteobacteria bacterium]